MLIRTADALALFEGSPTKLARALPPTLRKGQLKRLSRQAVYEWGEFLPPLRARQLLDLRPDAAAYVVGEDGRTAAERIAAKSGEQYTRTAGSDGDTRGEG